MDTPTEGVSDSFVILKQGAVCVDSLLPQFSPNGMVFPTGFELLTFSVNMVLNCHADGNLLTEGTCFTDYEIDNKFASLEYRILSYNPNKIAEHLV